MTELRFDRWLLRIDPAATAGAFARIGPGPETCGCSGCRNFAAVRRRVYPPEFMELCGRLGVPPGRECEVYHVYRRPDGAHFYGGWIHFVGSVQVAPDARDYQRRYTQSEFSFYFTSQVIQVPEALKGLPVAQIEFAFVAPWVLDEPEMTGSE